MLLELALRLCSLYQRCFPVALFLKQSKKFCFKSTSKCSFDAVKELCISSAGAIYVKEGSFTQSGGTSTITDASAGSDGGVVRMLRNPFILAVLQRRRVSGG